MGPLLIGIGLALTSYLLSIPVIADVDTTFNVKTHLLGWLPFLMTSIAFILLYILVPNCYVYKKYAVSAGVICAILFEFCGDQNLLIQIHKWLLHGPSLAKVINVECVNTDYQEYEDFSIR